VALGLVYFVGYETPAGRPSVLEAFLHPVQLFTWYLIALGSVAAQLGRAYTLPILVGAGLIVTWAWLLLSSRRHPVPPLLLGWTLFLLASTATIAIGRAPLGVEALGNSRYRIYSEFAVLIAIVAVISRRSASRSVTIERGLVAVLLPLAAVWAWASWNTNLAALAEFSLARRNALDHYIATGGQGMYGDFPPQDFGDFILARTRDSGQFQPAHDASPASSLVEAGAPQTSNQPLPLFAAPAFSHAGALSVHGQSTVGQPTVTLWLRGSDRHYRGALRRERIPEPIFTRGRTAFWNTWTLAGIAPGRYQVGYAQSESAEREAGTGVDSPVYWTGDSIDVK
jgi:hypothetical protein